MAPKTKPPALKIMEGVRPGRDSGGRLIKDVPAFNREAPPAPIWLSPEARSEWNRVVPELHRLGVLKTIDMAALTAYCECWSRFVRASLIVAKEGMVLQDDKQGRAQRHPALLTAEAASKELRAWAGEFGLTPSAENRLATSKGKDGDEEASPFAA